VKAKVLKATVHGRIKRIHWVKSKAKETGDIMEREDVMLTSPPVGNNTLEKRLPWVARDIRTGV